MSTECFDVCDKIEKAMFDLRKIPTVLTLMIEAFGFDSLELSDHNKRDIINRYDVIQDILYLTLGTINKTIEEIQNIIENNDTTTEKSA